MLKAIAIDDEPLALKVITRFCAQMEGIQLEKTFTSQVDALKHIRKYPVDLLFLDIQMPGKSGIDFYKKIENSVPVIFTTAYNEYAVEGFNVNAVDYLVKPFSQERFREAVHKAIQRQQYMVHTTSHKYLLIRADYKLHKIAFEDILFIQALDNYVSIYLNTAQKITTQISMKEILEKLPQQDFVRIHRSYIVSVKHITIIHHKAVHIAGMELPVGERFKSNLQQLL